MADELEDKKRLDKILTREDIMSRIAFYLLDMEGVAVAELYNRVITFAGVDRPDVTYQGDDFWVET